jgi:hypothetical protein
MMIADDDDYDDVEEFWGSMMGNSIFPILGKCGRAYTNSYFTFITARFLHLIVCVKCTSVGTFAYAYEIKLPLLISA